MKQSKLLIPTLREAPAEAEVVSHRLMLRAGMIRKLASGIYTFLPLALRVLEKIQRIIREEMERAGAQELLMPMVLPAELWQETGRWNFYGKELLRFKDRHEREFCLGPTHEEAITDLIRNTVDSYRALPLNLFQIQSKFRDEIRPRFGLMRGREFIMKDGYSFHRDEACAHKTYQAMYEAYQRIFTRCGLKFRAVEAMTGAIGGSLSHEFQVLAQSGEDSILASSTIDYAANVEKAPLAPASDLSALAKKSGSLAKVSTPQLKSVEEVAKFLQLTTQQVLKTLIYQSDKGLIAILLRGDHVLMEEKLKSVAGVTELTLATAQDIEIKLQSAFGFSGPVGLTIPMYADYAVAQMEDFVIGANEKDFHYQGANLGDFEVLGFFDLRCAVAGDACPRGGVYEEYRGIEVGHVFYLGDKYSKAMRAVYKDESGQELPMSMGCYGIGVSRTAAAAIEQNHDANGMIWPLAIAPFHIHLLSLNPADAQVAEVSARIYQDLNAQGYEVLWDERDESPGVKFKDSDLIGIPYRVVVGAKGLKEGIVELKFRQSGDMQKIAVDQIVEQLSIELAKSQS